MTQKNNKPSKESIAHPSSSASLTTANSNLFFSTVPGDLIQLIGSYAQDSSAQPTLWTHGEPATSEVQFQIQEGFLEYRLKNPSGELVNDSISLKTLNANRIPIEKLEPITQETLHRYWPKLARILAARDQIHYDMKEANALSAATNNPDKNLKKELVDHLMWLIKMGKQDEAEKMIKVNPLLLLERSTEGVTPYQYSMCSRNITMLKMIRQHLPQKAAESQAAEFESGKNKNIEDLYQHFEEIYRKTKIVYGAFINNTDQWTTQQGSDYLLYVVGRSQDEWTEQWRQELCYPSRSFDEKTKFTSGKALPEVELPGNQPLWLRRRDDSFALRLKILMPDIPLTSIEPNGNPMFLKQGDQYYLYTPQIPEDKELDQAVEWKMTPFPEAGNVIDKMLNSLQVAFLGEEKNETRKTDLKKQAEENNTPLLIDQAGILSIYGRNEYGHWQESKLDKYDERMVRTNLSLPTKGVKEFLRETLSARVVKLLKQHHLALPFEPDQGKFLFLSPVSHRLLYQSLAAEPPFQKLLGLPVYGRDTTVVNENGAIKVTSSAVLIKPHVKKNLAGLIKLHETSTRELKDEFDRVIRHQEKRDIKPRDTKLIEETRAEINKTYEQHLSKIQAILLKYKYHLESHGFLKDALYNQKLAAVNELLRPLGQLEIYKENETAAIRILPQSKHKKFKQMTDDFTQLLCETRPKEYNGQSIAEIFAMQRTKLNFKDTGLAVLKGVATALAHLTVLPAVLTFLITKKSVHSHLFKVTGKKVEKELKKELESLHQSRSTILDHIHKPKLHK